MKLWKKNYELDKEIEKFTVGNDYLLDNKLVEYDCIASIAHAKMLKKIGILSGNELDKLIKGLNKIILLHKKGSFMIKPEDEDCHTAIENYLTQKYGNAGKKIHSLRSRNDQVLTALRLYEKNEISEIKKLLGNLKSALSNTADKGKQIHIPGYTHMQKAMPMTIKTWLGCFADSIDDNLKLLDCAYELIDKSPLGSAAGFGIPVFKIDQKMTSELMGFSGYIENPVYAQMSRGKFESIIMNILTQIMHDLNKLSTDLIMFSMSEFGFFSLPDKFCTGSSIMPQKKNPDVLELIRAKYHVVLGDEFKIKSITSNLISGYNRDIQMTKEPLFNSIDTTKNCLKMMCLVLHGLKINKDKCKQACTKEIYATEMAYKLVKKGIPFRDAYKKIAEQILN
ncbi:MAG: argininosuccinate lyase [Nanoarchaeota archaeon]|nr:argininosuccinate lyase [Nanoarchaeota archaeon]